ncbi:MAG: hypothetical protein ABIP48_28110 [Planctomycetota bacterium]
MMQLALARREPHGPELDNPARDGVEAGRLQVEGDELGVGQSMPALIMTWWIVAR